MKREPGVPCSARTGNPSGSPYSAKPICRPSARRKTCELRPDPPGRSSAPIRLVVIALIRLAALHRHITVGDKLHHHGTKEAERWRIAGLTLLVAIEKLAPFGTALATVTGAALITGGAALVVAGL